FDSDAALAEPASALLVREHDDLPAALEDEVEVAPTDRLVGPPAVDDSPLFADDSGRLPVDDPGRPAAGALNERSPRLVYSSRGTSNARCSGMRDHGATSTIEYTPPAPVLARTCRRPSLRRRFISTPSVRNSSSCCPVDSVSWTSSTASSVTG